ncbi:hypothetical protein ACTA71_000881 [Dictyostelium dimigraforme]
MSHVKFSKLVLFPSINNNILKRFKFTNVERQISNNGKNKDIRVYLNNKIDNFNNINNKYIKSSKKRQHTNPLANQQKLEPPQWKEIYTNPNLPFLIDIGSCEGHMLLDYSEQFIENKKQEKNLLGLEIRKPYVLIANQNKNIHQSNFQNNNNNNNIHFIWCNANTNILDMGLSIPKGLIKEVTIFFPDPWFKVRHHKRRLINEKFVKDLFTIGSDDIKIYVQTDSEDLYNDITTQFNNSNLFSLTFYIKSDGTEDDEEIKNIWKFPKSRYERYFNKDIHKLIYEKKKQ